MSEGNVYPCSWKRVPGGYRVWWTADPTVAAEDAEFEEADELLVGLIHDATGDGENIHVYDPPEPSVEHAGPSERGQLWLLGKPTTAYMLDPEQCFTEGLCDNCVMPRGQRTDVPMTITRLEGRYDAAMVKFGHVGIGIGPILTVVSERFLALLSPEEHAAFEWRRVQHDSRAGAFFELVHRQPTIPDVSAKGHDTYYGRCDTCGFTWVVTNSARGKPDGYVAERDMPVPARTLVAVGPWAYAGLAVTPERWKELVGKPGMRGIKGSPISIIAEEAVERAPTYRPRERARRKEQKRDLA